jgi:hypothetical protein
MSLGFNQFVGRKIVLSVWRFISFQIIFPAPDPSVISANLKCNPVFTVDLYHGVKPLPA